MEVKEKIISIRIRILRLAVIAILMLAITMGSASVIIVDQISKRNSEQIMTELCEEQTLRFNSKLDIVAHSVNMIYEYSNQLALTDGVDIYAKTSEEKIKDIAISVVEQTNGAMAIYFRYNPEIVGNGTSGFFWSKESENGNFIAQSPTDILAYSSTDIEHVGWFYEPKKTGKPLWMAPYLNQNLNVFMISYIIPFYKGSEFVGVIGMDIDFNEIMGATENVELYKTGSLALVDLSERLLYRSNSEGNAIKEKLSNELYNHITTINKSSNLLTITEDDGTKAVICCNKLSNGMVLYVNVPKSEIFSNRNQLIFISILITLLISSITILFVFKSTTNIVKPLRKLTSITNKYASGDWSESYISESNDEVYDLSKGIAIMAKNNQEYLNKLNTLARTDALTGLRNNTGYHEIIEEINANRHEKYTNYAIVVMDLNLLKKTNDTYGHEAGDALLCEAAKYMSKMFAHSPIFRIGGDEFVSILINEDFDNKDEIIDRFATNMNYKIKDVYNVKLSIAYGISTYPLEGSSYDELFKIADERMYNRKKQMKAEEQI